MSLSLVAAGSGCSRTSAPVGGLLVNIDTDGSFADPLTKLRVIVAPMGDAAPYLEHEYAIPSQAELPASLGIRSNGDPAASVVVEVSVWSAERPLDMRRYEILRVPTSTVQDIDVMLSARCTPYVLDQGGILESSCGPSKTCDPMEGQCTSDIYGEVALTEGGATAEADGDALDSEASDAEVATVAHADGGDGSTSCTPEGALQCNGSTPQRCDAGRWADQAPCGGNQECSQGLCQPVPPSCMGGGPLWSCNSWQVPGGTFDRSYDGVTYTDASFPAMVHAFRLDEFEVTIQRFAPFKSAVVSGAGLPDAGAGKHAHLNGGRGLVVEVADGGPLYESGWDPAWAQGFGKTLLEWSINLSCVPTGVDTDGFMSFEPYPVNCVTWYEAYAFCIWDGGFLPTEAEWNYAAAGAAQQRVYPWGSHDPGQGTDYAVWGCYHGANGLCTNTLSEIGQVGEIAAGVGLWGQWDLAGNVAEWTLDAYQAPYPMPCVDCAAAGPGAAPKVYRGGSYDLDKRYLLTSERVSTAPTTRAVNIGFRCARSP